MLELGRIGAVEGFDVFFDEGGEVDEAGVGGVHCVVAGDARIAERRGRVCDGGVGVL